MEIFIWLRRFRQTALQNKCWGVLGEIKWHYITKLLWKKSLAKWQLLKNKRGSWALLLKLHLQSGVFWHIRQWTELETFAAGENPKYFGIYSRPVQAQTSKLSSLLHCPSSQKTCGKFTTFQFNWFSSWDWSSCMYLFHPTFIDCYKRLHFSHVFLFMAATPLSKVILLHCISRFGMLNTVTLCETKTLRRPKSLRELLERKPTVLYYNLLPCVLSWMCSLLNDTFAGQGVISK